MVLEKISTLKGATLHALDGDIGHVTDFYFDDERWTIRYVSVKTGAWLQRHHVILSIMSLLVPDWNGKRIPVRLTQDQVRHSPDVTTHPEVSRAREMEVLTYYGYPFYWSGDALWGPVANPVFAAEEAAAAQQTDATPPTEDSHLHRCQDVIGYHVHARDGEIGHIDEFLVDPETWSIHGLVLDTSNWIGGTSVVVEPSSIGRIDWAGRNVRVNLSRDTIATSPGEQAATTQERKGAPRSSR